MVKHLNNSKHLHLKKEKNNKKTKNKIIPRQIGHCTSLRISDSFTTTNLHINSKTEGYHTTIIEGELVVYISLFFQTKVCFIKCNGKSINNKSSY